MAYNFCNGSLLCCYDQLTLSLQSYKILMYSWSVLHELVKIAIALAEIVASIRHLRQSKVPMNCLLIFVILCHHLFYVLLIFVQQHELM